MKKIFAYIGSRAGEKSRTFFLTSKILENIIQKSGNSIEYEIYSADKINITNCQSCNSCFITGSCPLDCKNGDNMGIIKKKMIEADFIILGSPIYLHNVSGDMKTFLDRISYWSHLMRLAGKCGVTVSTSSGNGASTVNDYLEDIMCYFGINVIGKIYANWSQISELEGGVSYNNEIEKYSSLIYDYLIDNKTRESNDKLEYIFDSYKTAIKRCEKNPNAEYNFWKESGYFECDSFSELVDKVHKK